MLKAASISARWAALSPPTTLVLTESVTSVAVGRSVRSRSVKSIEPESVSVVPSVMSPVTSSGAMTGEMTGASLLPVMLMVTTWVSVPPLPSSTVTVYSTVTVSPGARKSSSASVIE